MTADKPRQPGARRRKGRQVEPAAPDPGTTPRAGYEPRLVDVDPWAMMLEQLLEVPDEADQSERKPSEGK